MARKLLTRDVVRRYSVVSTSRWMGAAALEWAIIISTMFVCRLVGGWLICIPAAVLIGTRQHALGVLAHDGSHQLVSTNRTINDLLSDLLAAYPIGFTTVGFRSTHLRHHAFLETAKDPSRISVDLFPDDWTFPMSRRRVATILTRDLTGLNQRASSKLLKYLWEIPGGIVRHVAQLLLFHVVAAVVFWQLGVLWMYFALWLLPLFTVAIAAYRIRAVAEHSGLDEHSIRYGDESADPLSATRTTIPRNPVAGFLMAPYHISYHIEHHLYPSVPVFALARLHEELRDAPDYAETAHITSGHIGLYQELTAGARR